MSHGHDHHGVIQDHTHAERCMYEYHNYRYLFVVSFVGAIAEFFIALVLAHSVSAQADAIHALTHLALYALACFVSRQIITCRMDPHQAYHYHEKFLKLYALFVFIGLAWVSYTSIIKLWSPEIVISGYMLLGVSIGLFANIIALKILNDISKKQHEVIHKHTAYAWIRLDTWGDFAFSVIVLITSLASLAFPLMPIRVIDPVISLIGVAWIALSGAQILKGKKII